MELGERSWLRPEIQSSGFTWVPVQADLADSADRAPEPRNGGCGSTALILLLVQGLHLVKTPHLGSTGAQPDAAGVPVLVQLRLRLSWGCEKPACFTNVWRSCEGDSGGFSLCPLHFPQSAFVCCVNCHSLNLKRKWRKRKLFRE